jgi:hypothetical protein
LELEPGVTVAGRLAFDNREAAPDPTTFRVSLSPVLTGGAVAVVTQPVQADAQGNFTLANITPGHYRFSASPAVGGRGAGPSPAQPPPPPAVQPSPAPWVLKSAALRGRETLDSGLDVRQGEPVSEVVLTFTSHPTTINGTLQDASGRPASDYFVILYAADRAFWAPPSRRVLMVRPASDGKYSFRNVPAGDYLLAAATDVDQGEWMDPAFLTQFVPASIKLSIADGETKTQDIRIAVGR